MDTGAIKIFIAYSRLDSEMLGELKKQFYPLEISQKITVWHDGAIVPGEKWDEKIQKELDSADIIMLLVSPDSISSSYFYESEVQKAIQRDEKGETKVIPVILRPCLWQETPISKLQALPKNGNAIINWTPIDMGYFNVVESVKEIVDDLLWQKQYEKQSESILKVEGRLQFHDSEGIKVEFEGEVVGGKANGYGVARSSGNGYYEYKGHYINNLRHDKNAKIIWAVGNSYEGEFRNDKRTGKGKFQWDNENEYVGDFLENAITGIGIYKTEKYIYEGEMKNQVPHRRGNLIHHEQKFTYDGEFWEGVKRGKGKIEYNNGLIYEGDFLEDQPHGKGRMTDENGVVYEGQFWKGKIHGMGRRVNKNGVIYEGEFRNGAADGKGKIFTEKFIIYEGFFNGDWVSSIDEIFVDMNGNKIEYDLDYSTNRRYTIFFYNGDIYEGVGALSYTGWYTFSNGVKVRVEVNSSDKGNSFDIDIYKNETKLKALEGFLTEEKPLEMFPMLDFNKIEFNCED